jgi:MFS superfamily sulfate permease-like transporter
MVEGSGARSQFAQVATAAMVAVVLLFLTRPLQYLPRCVLSAIVFVIAVRLIDLRGLRDILSESPGEFWLAVMTAAVVVAVGVEQGIVLAMVVSLLRIVRHSYRPHTGVMIRNDKGFWQTIPAVPGTVTEPGLAIYRFGAPLFYANAGRFCDEIMHLSIPGESQLRWVIVDSEAMTNVDYSAARMVVDLNRDLVGRGIVLVFARVHAQLQADLDRHHISEKVGVDRIFFRLHDAIRAFAATKPEDSASVPES